MTALITFLVIIVLSALVIRVATVALTMTGISRDVARFQTLSAFTGVGFTTIESEQVINHPVRRRIVTIVILLGNLGFFTTLTTLVLTFVGPDSTGQELTRILILIGSLTTLAILATSQRLDQILSKMIRHTLSQWTELDLKLHDYEAMLNLTNGYGVSEMVVNEKSWVADQTLAEARLPEEGIIVLGIKREDESYVGAPQAQTRICVGDRLILYGLDEDIAELDTRLSGSTGDARHKQAVKDQSERVREQDAQDTYSR